MKKIIIKRYFKVVRLYKKNIYILICLYIYNELIESRYTLAKSAKFNPIMPTKTNRTNNKIPDFIVIFFEDFFVSFLFCYCYS